jgi:competence protein ComEC
MPMLRIALAFSSGIICQHQWPELFTHLIGPLVIGLSLCLVLNRYLAYRLQLVLSVILLVTFWLIGGLYLQVYRGDFDRHFLKNQSLEGIHSFHAMVEAPPIRKDKTYALTLRVYRLVSAEGERSANGLLLAYADTLKAKELRIGDLLWIQGAPQPVSPNDHPAFFDYPGYLALRKIHFQNFIGCDFEPIGYQPPSFLKQWVHSIRQRALGVFDQYLKDPFVLQVAKALVLGQKKEMDRQITSAYADAGAIHVLAVSGLHVGLIYLFIVAVLGYIPLGPDLRRWFVPVISIIVLFLYALLTGLSPSVFRAFVMFSLFAMGRLFRREPNIYNVLASSGMLLLLVHPYFIFDVGFQLSYLAVLGIVYWQPKLFALISFRFSWSRKLWSLTCVSMAAQLATAPLGLYYFNQFPTYFLVANLLIIPAAFIILILGISLLLFSFFVGIAEFLAKTLEWAISLLNGWVNWLSNWPSAVLESTGLALVEVLAIYGMLLFLSLFLRDQRKRFLIWLSTGAIIFISHQMVNRMRLIRSKDLVIYTKSGRLALELRYGPGSMLVSDSLLRSDSKFFSYQIEPFRRYRRVNKGIEVPNRYHQKAHILVFEQNLILLPPYFLDEKSSLQQVEWDLVITSNPTHLEFLKAKEFVLNSSRNRTPTFEREAIYSLAEEGLYVKKWR